MISQPPQHAGKLIAGLVGLLLSFANVVQADPWTDGGSTVYVTDTSDVVGIGTTSPSTNLDVVGSSLAAIRVTSDTVPSLRVYSTNSSANTRNWLLGSDITAYGDFQIMESTSKGGDPRTAGISRLAIDGSGNVGIGTNSPSANLDVVATSLGMIRVTSETIPSVRIYSSNSSSSTRNWMIGTDVTSYGDFQIRQSTAKSGDPRTAGTSYLTIDPSGNVGIGTTSPDAKLDLVGREKIVANDGDTWALYANSDTAQDDEGGLYGEATATSAQNTVGVWGVTSGTGNANGQPIGVRGDAKDDASSEGQYGVLGYNWADSQTSGKQGAGVFGGSMGGDPSSPSNFTGRGHGVQGETYASNDNSAGGIFYTNSSNGASDAVRAIVSYDANNNSGQYAIKADGDSVVSGSKSALVNTDSQGPTEMYSIESSEIWFEEIGEGQLVNGEVRIAIDPLFLETITVDKTHPMQVFIQPYASTAMYVERGADSFTVHAINDPTSSASFAYRIMGKREHYEDRRMRQTTGPIDHFMEPDLTAEELLLLNERWGMGDSYKDTYYHEFNAAYSSEIAGE